MSREDLARICARLPGAELSDPWGGGHDAWKVGGKMFACVGTMDQGVSVKCPDVETAEMLIDSGHAVRAPYFHRSWVLLTWDTLAPPEDLEHRVLMAYREIRSKLTKKVQATLGPMP